VSRALALAIVVARCASGSPAGDDPAGTAPSPTAFGEHLYRSACASCHGIDGKGVGRDAVGFEEPLPDFTDCSFATREPDGDWGAVIHDGGPTRGFSPMMPAFGQALDNPEIQAILDHVRTFCGSDDWPRGELNLPRPLVTEKAYPEDEAVWTIAAAAEGRGSVVQEIVYERRLGTRNQVELVVPFAFRETQPPGEARDWTGGIGDVALAFKRALFHSLDHGTIFSVAGEAILPTGDEEEGFGKGTIVLEPFVALGQILPADGFLHLQAGFEIPVDRDEAVEEGFWRVALGKSFTQGSFGRTWSPMLEVVGFRELTAGEEVQWDVLPQTQITLNTRQHVMANAGLRIPLDTERDMQMIVYLLWDWFDGGLFAGW
jgi:mono/diheme cytochrome c family protein